MRNKIDMYMHCMLCLKERPDDIAPADWARLNVGTTRNGLQVWCVRHDVNVGALDFRGHKVAFEGEDESPKPRAGARARPTKPPEPPTPGKLH